jgi:hypothetical protein
VECLLYILGGPRRAFRIEFNGAEVGANDEIPVLASLDDKVASGEEIFAYPYCPMYYSRSATTNPTRYGGLVYNFNTPTPSQFEEVIRVLEQHRVRYVLWDTNFQAKAVAAMFPASARMPP